jgi:hypothetical protein
MVGPVDLDVARVVARAARAMGPLGTHWSKGDFHLPSIEPPWRAFCVLGASQSPPLGGALSLWRASCLLDRLAIGDELGLGEALLGSEVADGLGALRWTDAPLDKGREIRRFLRRAARVAAARLLRTVAGHAEFDRDGGSFAVAG